MLEADFSTNFLRSRFCYKFCRFQTPAGSLLFPRDRNWTGPLAAWIQFTALIWWSQSLGYRPFLKQKFCDKSFSPPAMLHVPPSNIFIDLSTLIIRLMKSRNYEILDVFLNSEITSCVSVSNIFSTPFWAPLMYGTCPQCVAVSGTERACCMYMHWTFSFLFLAKTHGVSETGTSSVIQVQGLCSWIGPKVYVPISLFLPDNGTKTRKWNNSVPCVSWSLAVGLHVTRETNFHTHTKQQI